MGWTGGTEIMDAAVRAAREVADHVAAYVWAIAYVEGQTGGEPDMDKSPMMTGCVRERTDHYLRPHVRRVSDLLQDRGWDSPEEADDFAEFSQEMLGYDDNAFEGWLRHTLSEATRDGTPDEILAAAQRLKAHTDKLKEGTP